ncbi:polysaccharide biosynthesis C-terminal domain-containing protein [Bacillus sp. N9]
MGNDFINLWVGVNYKEAWLIAIIIMLPFTIDLLQNVGVQILYAKNMHAFRGVALLGSSIFNIIISIYLVNQIGIIGAAIGTAFSYVLGNVLLVNLYYHFRVGLNIPRYFKETLSKILPAILITGCLGANLLYTNK